MANIPFKSITFPGLPNKYTVPEISSDLMTAGKAADAKATGDALSALEDQFTEETDQLKADLRDIIQYGRQTFSFDWENGGLNSHGNNTMNGEAYAIRTPTFFTELDGKEIVISANGEFTVSWYIRIFKYTMDGTCLEDQQQVIYANKLPQTAHFDNGYKYRMAWIGPTTTTVSEDDITFAEICEQEYIPAVVAAQFDAVETQIDDLHDKSQYETVCEPESSVPRRFNFDAVSKCHVSFSYRWNNYPEYYLSTEYIPLCSVFGNLTKAMISARSWISNNGTVHRANQIISQNAGEGSVTKSLYDLFHQPFTPQNALWIKYDGTADVNTDVECVCTRGSIVFAHHNTSGTIATVTYQQTDTVDSLIAAINALTDFSAGAIETAGHTCAELSINYGVTIPLYVSLQISSATNYDCPKINIPFAVDMSVWHTCEVVLDIDNRKAYAAFDGETIESVIDLTAYDGGTYIEIGGTYHGANAPITTKDIVINYGHFGDAEIVQSYVWPFETTLPQLISGINPKLLIWEGHGVDVGPDSGAPYTDDMAVTTDRLNAVFAALSRKGYEPVTWQDVIAWKINNKALPKRCYVMMMDDFRFENYVDYEKRIPFNRYNVKAGLAVISGRYALTDTVVVNGQTYTVAQMIDMTNRAGWYPASHTKDHVPVTQILPSALDAEFEQDALSCNDIGIYSDIMIYPHGSYNKMTNAALQRTPFKLGVAVGANRYNCKRINNYALVRVEIGTRAPLADVLAQIV